MPSDGTLDESTRARSGELDELVAVMARLRGPGGCAWDAEQTHESLTRYLLEETYELLEAIESGARDDLVEELGDVLYQVLFHADIAAHTAGEDFDVNDVAARMTAKMIGRHPHVFGDEDASTAAEVVELWDEVKRREKPTRTSVLDGIPLAMPALARADKVVGRAARVGVEVVVDASESADEDAFGAELLGLVAAARSRGVDPERALRLATRRLEANIRAAESRAAEPQAPGRIEAWPLP